MLKFLLAAPLLRGLARERVRDRGYPLAAAERRDDRRRRVGGETGSQQSRRDRVDRARARRRHARVLACGLDRSLRKIGEALEMVSKPKKRRRTSARVRPRERSGACGAPRARVWGSPRGE